ncbi:MAG: amidase [Actinomycetota bacterium]|nr:amidase [Actinomycetota bacterium]MEC9394589.1 amidase [Actinomycetota bacterium]MED6328757.1 amidase [Actinomycetota bacterium]
MTEPIWRRNATELAGMVADGDVSAREVVDAHLARIDEVNGWLNALVVVDTDGARTAADQIDRGRAAGEPLGPLAGVPFTVKDGLDLAGHPTTYGIAAFADNVAPVDDPTVGRLRAAGAVPIGKSNQPEMAMRLATDNTLFGLTRNPWHPDRTPSGSSGGEASAIASGMAPMGVGTDLGGSVRNPAYACGIAATKTSLGRLPVHGTTPAAAEPLLGRQWMAVAGPMARSVADLAAMMRATVGRHPRDPRTVDVPYDGAGFVRRVAVPTELPGGPIHPDAREAVHRAGEALAAEGWEVVDATPPEMELCYDLWGRLVGEDFPTTLHALDEFMSRDGSHLMRSSIRFWPAGEVAPQVVHVERLRLARQWALFLDEHPVVVLPTWYQPPFAHGDDLADDIGVVRALYDGVFTPITAANLLGLPATQVPVGCNDDGVPLGVQFMADRHREDRTLTAAAVVEAAHPPITPIDPVTH